jgi:putative endonuclease
MNYFVYILYSHSTDSFYKGQTSNIIARIKRHNNKLEKATETGSPWELIWYIEKTSRKEALILEKKLKNLDRSRLVKFMLKYSNGVASPDTLTFLSQWSGC